MQQVQETLGTGDGAYAEILLRQMIEGGANRDAVAAYLGEAELLQGELAEAREWLEPGIFSQQTRAHGFHMLGRLEMAAGNLPAAGAAFDRALAENAKNAALWIDIARLRYRGGEQLQAIEASDHALELSPNNSAALMMRAQLLRDAEGPAAALPWFDRALQSDPDNTDMMYERAATLGEMGRTKEMLSAIRTLVEIDPENTRGHYLQAILAAGAGQYELAGSLLQRTSAAVQSKPAAQLLSAIIDIENANYASAAQTLERLHGAQPDNRRVRLLFARSLALGEYNRELVYLFEAKARQSGASPYLQTLVGRALEVLDRRQEAGFFLDEAARGPDDGFYPIPPSVTVPFFLTDGGTTGPQTVAIVRSAIEAGQSENAFAAAEQFAKRFAGSGDAMMLAGDAAYANGDSDTALQFYERATRIRQSWLLTRKLGAAYIASGREGRAVVLYDEYFERHPGNMAAAAFAGRQQAARGQWREAARSIDRAIALGGGRNPDRLTLRATIALEIGDVDTALVMAQEAYAIQPLNRAATEVLARAYRAAGNRDTRAIALERKARRLRK